jgi:ferritin-like metal-binding protein YciE
MSLQMTQAAAKATDDPTLHELFEHHHEETQEHERLIRERIEAHGESTSKLKDLGGRFAAMGKGVGAMAPADTPGRLARDGYVQEHTEVAAYELLCRVAERAGDSETAQVGRRILEERAPNRGQDREHLGPRRRPGAARSRRERVALDGKPR